MKDYQQTKLYCQIFDLRQPVMEMTLSRLGLDNVKSLLSGFVMPIGILVLVAMMVLPLPVYLLDTFFVSNILLSLLIPHGGYAHP